MREIYKTYSQKGKKQVKTTTISIALLVVATLIFSSALPAMAIQTNSTKMNKIEREDFRGDPTDRDPNFYTKQHKASMTAEGASNPSEPLPPLTDVMMAYNAYSPSMAEGPVWFEIEDPGTVNFLKNTDSGYFIAGGTWTCDDEWLGVQYNNGLLWQIDPETGDMTSIGGGGTGLNGCSWDPAWGRLYGVSSTALYEIDPDTGEQDLKGQLGIPNSAICIVIDLDGIAWLWDVLFSGYATLYNVDLESGDCTEYCSIGENLLYAQDGDYDRETGILWFTAYSATGFLAYFDFDAEELVHIGNFEGGAELTASCFMADCIPPEHDIKLVSVDSPQTGRAEPNMDMTITVKNSGNNTETFDAQMEIIKCESGPLIYEEYFDDCVMPDGWETDYWTVVSSSYASGEPCEARVYNYDQYYGGQYYDNYIMSPPTDCTGAEKVNLRFRWAGQYSYPQYCSVYVKFRRNSTSQWKDVTPWDNPVNSNQDGQLYEIGCYGFGEPIGEEFQMQWNYVGYYSYFYYMYLDDVTLEACGGCAEYAELIEDITLDKEEEIQLQFPKWTPSEWHNESAENTWEEYPVNAFIICEEDEKPRNNEKWILIDLWYPWMHDIEVMSIDSPHEEGRSMPAQTFEVQATMQNVGQYPECCIPIDIKIGNPFIVGTLLSEYDWPGTTNPYGSGYQTYFPGYDTGWRDEHKSISYYYGWWRSSSSYSGGSPYEAYLPYYYCYQDYHFYSAAIDASDYQMLRLRFLTYINHYSGQGLYSLEAGYSTDLNTWYAAWHEEPGSTQGYEVDVPIEGGSDTLYIGFWVKGNPYYFNYWYLDNVELVATGYTEEYSDFACQGPDIEPGEEVTFTFDDWTPAFLAEETTGSQDYIVEASISCEADKNPGNDIKTEEFTLDFWHDVGIDRITSPVGEGHPRAGDEILWDNGEPNGLNGLAGSMYAGYSNILIDDFHMTDDWNIQGGKIHYLWNSGYSSNLDKIRVYIFEDEGDCDPSQDEYPTEGYYVEANVFDEYTTGTYYFSRPEVIADFTLDEEFEVPAGDWYIGIQPDGVIDDIAYLLTADGSGCEVMADLPYWGYPRWSSSSYLWGTAYDLAFEIHGNTGGAPGCKAWIQPGTQDIKSVVKNYGTFTKEDLTCYAQIWEFITDPENGTEVWTDEIGNIDLTEPLGGEKNLQFSDFTFADEGKYGLFMQFPAEPDDETGNNNVRWGVCVDDTRPYCDYPPIFDPEEPDGTNGWYISDVTVTLNATDPWSNGVSSGVKEIRYTINGGAEQVIPDKTGSFEITQDGKDIEVEYWAVDWVGNVEASHNEFTIDMDQTMPEVALEYEVTGGSPLTGWEFTFTATATDDMSGMDKVEFYFNNELQYTAEDPDDGTDKWSWSLMYFPIPKAVFRSTAYDLASLFNSDEIWNPVTSSTPSQVPTQQTSQLPRAQPLPR